MNTAQKNITIAVGTTTLEFQRVLTATSVDGQQDNSGAVVRFQEHADNLAAPERGVYVITVNAVPVYVGKYETSFSKRWLYAKLNMIYHHKRNAIADSIAAGSAVEIYAVTETQLRRQIIADDGPERYIWINVSGVESALIQHLQPIWNLVH